MTEISTKIILIIGFPLVVFLGGAWIMSEMSNHQYVTQLLQCTLKGKKAKHRKPLNQRLRGYDVNTVDTHWGAFDDDARASELYFLQLDLVFPLLYGAAFAVCLLIAWSELGKPVSPAWFLAPIAITVLADWTENLVQLDQLRRYAVDGKEVLAVGWIRIASIATTLKLVFFAASYLLPPVLVAWKFSAPLRHRIGLG